MSGPDLIRDVGDDGVLTLTLNRPETLNSLGGTLMHDLIDAFRRSKGDHRVRAIVVTGAGRGFCSGANANTGGPNQPPAERLVVEGIDPQLGESGELVVAMAESEAPVIGAINGPAAGAGFGLALSCDVRIASDQARMGSIVIKRGLATDFGVGYWLPRLVGPARAYELLYAGDLLDAQALLELGLVNRVVPHELLMDEALAYARTIADGPARAYAYTRRSVIAAFHSELRPFLEQEWTLQSELLDAADAREGFAAFREKRPPRFAR